MVLSEHLSIGLSQEASLVRRNTKWKARLPISIGRELPTRERIIVDMGRAWALRAVAPPGGSEADPGRRATPALI